MTKSGTVPAITVGQRVFTCGHSFHAWVPDIVAELAKAAGISGHQTVGLSAIGASRAIQHWDVPDDLNAAKKALIAGQVDVLTLTTMSYPDDGIMCFAKLAVAHNPKIRITLQELWLPEDRFPFDAKNRVRKAKEEFDRATMAKLQVPHEAYFRVMEYHARALNAELGGDYLLIVPDAQATLALRAHIIAGTAPGLRLQSDLFLDPWGHPAPPLKALSAYCHFSVIYRRSPVGLPKPTIIADNPLWDNALNRLLQELAWQAVAQHPMSGIGQAQA